MNFIRQEPVIFGESVGNQILTISGYSPVTWAYIATGMRMNSGYGMIRWNGRWIFIRNMMIWKNKNKIGHLIAVSPQSMVYFYQWDYVEEKILKTAALQAVPERFTNTCIWWSEIVLYKWY